MAVVFDPSLSQKSPAEKAEAYNNLLAQGYSDAQIKAAADTTFGAQSASDWSYLTNLASQIAPAAASPLTVEDLYQQYAGRTPDSEGLAFWKAGFGSEITPAEVESFKQSVGIVKANEILASSPNLTDAQIVAAMAQNAITPEQMSIATGVPVGEIVTRIAQTIPEAQTVNLGGTVVQPVYASTGQGETYQAGPLQEVLVYGSDTSPGATYQRYSPAGEATGTGQFKEPSSLGSMLGQTARELAPIILAATTGGLLSGAEGGILSGLTAEQLAAANALGGAEVAGGLTAAQAAGAGLGGGIGAGTGLLTGLGTTAAGTGLGTTAAGTGLGTTAAGTGLGTTAAGMGGGTGITAGAGGLGLSTAGAGLGAAGTGAGITAGTGLGTGVLSGSALGTGLLGTAATGALTGTGILAGSTLGTELLGTGLGSGVTAGGVTGLTGAGALGTGALTTGVGTGLGTAATGALTAQQIAGLISGGLTTGAGLLQQQTSREAAQRAQAMIDAETAAAKQAAAFRPVGMTTRFGTSQFQVDPVTGQLTSAGYTLSPEAKAQQDRLAALANQGLTQAEQAQQQFAPLQTGAQSLFSLGNQYLAQSPEAVAQNYLNQQMALLQPGRELELANLQNKLQQQGRAGLSVAQGGAYGATTPELQALYNARAMQEAQLAAQAQQAGQQQVSFGAGLLGQGTTALGNYYAGQQAAYTPYTTALGQVQGLETAAQQPLTMGAQLGQYAAQAGANVGRLGLSGAGASTALATGSAATTNPYSSLLSGLASNPALGQGIANLFL